MIQFFSGIVGEKFFKLLIVYTSFFLFYKLLLVMCKFYGLLSYLEKPLSSLFHTYTVRFQDISSFIGQW